MEHKCVLVNMLSTKELFDKDKVQASIQLAYELAKGRLSGEERGWLSSDVVKEHLKKKKYI